MGTLATVMGYILVWSLLIIGAKHFIQWIFRKLLKARLYDDNNS